MSNLITPLQQHKLGWDIFPMLPGTKGAYAHFTPDGDTAPTKWGESWERLTEDGVKAFWPEPGTHNVGVATGHRSGIWVLDIDVFFEDEAEAREYITEITGHEFPETLSVRTASGKWHFYFAMPDNPTIKVKTQRGLWPLIDVRGDGGMAVGICSTVGDDMYEVVTMVKPVHAPIALLERVKAKESQSPIIEGSDEKDVDEVADVTARPWIEAELQRLRDLPRPWEIGAGWHDTCFEVACNLSEFANSPWCSLTREEARRLYFEAAPRPEKDWNPAHEWGEGAKKTEGKGRARPLTSVDLGWFDEVGSTSPSKPSGAESTGEPLPSPHHWDAMIEQVQESGATFMLANAIRKVIPKVDGRPVLAHYQGVWYYWESSYWREAEQDEVFDFVARQIALVRIAEKTDEGLKLKPLAPTTSKVRDVHDAMASLLRRRSEVEEEGGICIYVGNGTVRVNGKDRDHSEASARVFNLSALPFAYDPEATCPQWDNFLRDIFEHDPEARLALQEWFGYFLVGDPGWLQKMFWLVGPKRSGKGTILDVARRLMGEAATATSLTMLSKDFGRENLVGKRLAIIDDARDPDPRMAHAVVEFLLTLSSGGFTSISRKHRRNWDGTLTSSLFAASNTIPRMPDDGGAISSRLEVIRTKKSFIGHEDTHLGDRLSTELPGILNWALDGLDRLRETERFTQAASASLVREEVDMGATGATPMVRQLLMVSDEFGMTKKDLRDAADWWAQQQEDSWRPNRLSIKSAIHAEFPDAMDRQRATLPSGEKVHNAWKGIVLKCRECDSPASRVTTMAGPECNLHLSNIFPTAVNG